MPGTLPPFCALPLSSSSWQVASNIGHGHVVLATSSGAAGGLAIHRVEVVYDARAEVLSIRLRDGEPRYVLVGRGTFVVFADDRGVWAVDLEAESWNTDPETVLRRAGAEI